MTSLDELKRSLAQHLNALIKGGDPADHIASDAALHFAHPINEGIGPSHFATAMDALRSAFRGVERRDQIFVAGDNLPDPRFVGDRPTRLVATMGYYQGVFDQSLFDIPATHGAATLRYCEVYECNGDGKIVQAWLLWDFLDVMAQAKVWPLPPSLGAENAWMPPNDTHGVRWETDNTSGQSAMDAVLAMHAALGQFDGKSLDSMPHKPYWAPGFMWYGPAGIGTSRGLTGFRAHHQIPFLHAFPDRAGASHYIRIGDGPFAVTGGWPSVTATHSGEWLGIGPTGRKIEMRVMDFYRIDNTNRIAENWVPIDIIHIALQMGVDLFARVRHLNGTPRTSL